VSDTKRELADCEEVINPLYNPETSTLKLIPTYRCSYIPTNN
jgi:hypothetical protein